MFVFHRNGSPRSEMRYSNRAPERISIGPGVTIRKSSIGGVSVLRLAASAKNGNTSSRRRGTQSPVRNANFPGPVSTLP